MSERYIKIVHTPDRAEPKQESEINLSDPILLKTKQGLVDFFSTYAKLQKDPIKFEPDLSTWVEEKATAALAEIESYSDVEKKDGFVPKKHFLGIYDGEKMVATGEVHILLQKNKQKYAHLCHLTVDAAYRNKQVGKKLVEARVELAKQEGCEFLSTLVNTRNLPAIQNKLNEDFYIKEVKVYRKKEPRWSEFKMFKKIDQQNQDAHDGVESEVETKLQIPLFEIEKIKEKLEQGYVGIKLVEDESAVVDIGKTVYEDGDVKRFALELKKI